LLAGTEENHEKTWSGQPVQHINISYNFMVKVTSYLLKYRPTETPGHYSLQKNWEYVSVDYFEERNV
jgi:hypothetical protein